MAMFGGRAQMPKMGFADKIGIVGDILSGNNATQQRLMAQQQATMPRYQQVGDSLLQLGADGQVGVAFDGRKPAAPHYWETNNGSLGMIGPDGQPQIVYNDPSPKVSYQAVDDPVTGQKTLYPVVNGQIMGAGQAAPMAGNSIPLQNGALPPGFKLRSGGAAPSGQGGFPFAGSSISGR